MRGTLLLRTAAVNMKERRKPVLLVREIPLSDVQLGNMPRVLRDGGGVTLASPGFCHRPARWWRLVRDLYPCIGAIACVLVKNRQDIPVTLFGPGEPMEAHKFNESVSLKKYKTVVLILADF